MKRIITLLMGMALFVSVQTAGAQSPLSLEIRPGVDFATQKMGGSDLGTGFGIGAVLDYRFMLHLSVYGGWGWHRFTSDDSFGGDFDIEETGYTFGLQFLHPIGTSQTNYFIRAGGIYNHIELENSDGDITADSGHGLGWQVEGGLAFALSDKWQLKPGVRYRSLSREIEVGDSNADADLSYVEVGVGFVRAF
jgi:opacity protein-like surface antigen